MSDTDPAPVDFTDERTEGGTPRPSVADQVAGAVARKVLGWLAGVCGAGLLVLLGGGLLAWNAVDTNRARAEVVHRTLERDVTTIAGAVATHEHPHEGIVVEIASLKTKVDEMATRQGRIERLLDERLPPRRARR